MTTGRTTISFESKTNNDIFADESRRSACLMSTQHHFQITAATSSNAVSGLHILIAITIEVRRYMRKMSNMYVCMWIVDIINTTVQYCIACFPILLITSILRNTLSNACRTCCILRPPLSPPPQRFVWR